MDVAVLPYKALPTEATDNSDCPQKEATQHTLAVAGQAVDAFAYSA